MNIDSLSRVERDSFLFILHSKFDFFFILCYNIIRDFLYNKSLLVFDDVLLVYDLHNHVLCLGLYYSIVHTL